MKNLVCHIYPTFPQRGVLHENERRSKSALKRQSITIRGKTGAHHESNIQYAVCLSWQLD